MSAPRSIWGDEAPRTTAAASMDRQFQAIRIIPARKRPDSIRKRPAKTPTARNDWIIVLDPDEVFPVGTEALLSARSWH
jgi:hypothetical protein